MAGDDMVAALQKRQHRRGDRGHAGREARGANALLHRVDFGFERSRRRIALAAICVAGLASLKHRGQIASVAIGVRY